MARFFMVLASIAISCTITPTVTNAQLNKTDSAFYQSAILNAINIYHASAGDQTALYNGSLYYGYPFRFKQGTPYFVADTVWIKGSVTYDGILYKDVTIEYDNLQDFVIVQDSLYWVQLNGKKVSEFTLLNRHFVRLEKNNVNKDIVTTGFYEVLYNGNVSIFRKDIKQIHEEASIVEGVERAVIVSSHYYIKKGDMIYPVSKESEITDILPDKKKEIRQFLKKNKLKFRKDKDNTLLQVAAFYEQLTKQI